MVDLNAPITSPDIERIESPVPAPGEERLLGAGRPSSALFSRSLVFALEIGGAQSQN